jgi:hypothetical protein
MPIIRHEPSAWTEVLGRSQARRRPVGRLVGPCHHMQPHRHHAVRPSLLPRPAGATRMWAATTRAPAALRAACSGSAAWAALGAVGCWAAVLGASSSGNGIVLHDGGAAAHACVCVCGGGGGAGAPLAGGVKAVSDRQRCQALQGGLGTRRQCRCHGEPAPRADARTCGTSLLRDRMQRCARRVVSCCKATPTASHALRVAVAVPPGRVTRSRTYAVVCMTSII